MPCERKTKQVKQQKTLQENIPIIPIVPITFYQTFQSFPMTNYKTVQIQREHTAIHFSVTFGLLGHIFQGSPSKLNACNDERAKHGCSQKEKKKCEYNTKTVIQALFSKLIATGRHEGINGTSMDHNDGFTCSQMVPHSTATTFQHWVNDK